MSRLQNTSPQTYLSAALHYFFNALSPEAAGAAAICFIIICSLATPNVCLASNGNSCDVEITGIVINQMRTNLGHRFYDNFAEQWSPPPGVGEYQVFMEELPSGRWGSLVYVKVNDVLVFQTILSPRGGGIESAAKQAIQNVMRTLVLQKIRALQGGDPDLDCNGY